LPQTNAILCSFHRHLYSLSILRMPSTVSKALDRQLIHVYRQPINSLVHYHPVLVNLQKIQFLVALVTDPCLTSH
jgi:hypothetical protein